MSFTKKIVKILHNKTTFEITFIVVLISLGFITFLSLCKSSGVAQRNIFYFDRSDTFMDFLNHLKYVALKDPYNSTYLSSGEKIYLPLSYLLFYPFSKLFDYIHLNPGIAKTDQLGLMSVVIFLIFICITFAIQLYELKNGQKAIRYFTVISLFVSGIFIFSIERANIIFISAIALTFFIRFYKSDNKFIRELALFALAVSSALKIYPAIFSILLIPDKRYKDFLRLIVYSLITAFLPFLFFNGGYTNLIILIKNIHEYNSEYMFSRISYAFGFSAIGGRLGLSEYQNLILSYISIFMLIIALLTAWSLEKFWKIILILSCALIISPANSGFYCGLYLFTPIILFLNEQDHPPIDWVYLFFLIIVLNPYQINKNILSTSSVISNLALILIYLILLVESTKSTIKIFTKKPLQQNG